MPQRDIYHQSVRRALVADQWRITHDPYRVELGHDYGYIDLGAEQLIGAAQGPHTIAVEVKSFVGISQIADLQQAIGQYALYRSWLRRSDPARVLWLAIDEAIANTVFSRPGGLVLVEDYAIQLLVVDVVQERIVAWRS